MHASGARFPNILLLTGISLLAVALIGSAQAAPSGHVIYEGSFQPKDLNWQTDAQGLVLPTFPGTRSLAQPGLPSVPVRELLLLVPTGMDVTSVQVEALATHAEKSLQTVPLALPQATLALGLFILAIALVDEAVLAFRGMDRIAGSGGGV